MIETRAPENASHVEAPPANCLSRRIAVMPAYNEAETITGVLERLYPLVDRLIIVDDGSTDMTREVVFEWLADRPRAELVSFNQNRGMSAAYYSAFQHLHKLVHTGEINDHDIVLTVDADGQHDPASIDQLLRPIEEGADAVIARRDFRLYPLYKRAGNWLMSAWASIWGGRRFRDVESGYRAFRIRALLDALQYYKGYKYSETVEIAVILPRLGYRIHDTTIVDIPVFRSRTRMKDVIIDLLAMPCAWWRVFSTRSMPSGMPRWSAYYALPMVFAAAAALLLRILTRGIYLADDTINNYVHVWYISDRLYSGASVPWHLAQLDGGRAWTFPYGMAPWMLNALLFPVLHEWSVTLFLVLGGVASAAGAMLVRPAMRDPWLMLPFIANPFFIDAIANGQYAFLWAAAAFFVMVWAVERERWVVCGAAMWFTASTHPIEGGLAVGVYLLWCMASRPEARKPLAIVSGLVAPLLAPSAYFALRTPALWENSQGTIVISILQDLPRRGTILAAPFALATAAPFLRLHYRKLGTAFAAAAVPGVLLSAGALGATGVADLPGIKGVAGKGGYYGLAHNGGDGDYRAYIHSADFQRGAVYRVLSPNEREQGAYFLIRAHAVLANELFSESQKRRNWDEDVYRCYLTSKHVDRVVVEHSYRREYPTNEQQLLDSFATRGLARLTYGGSGHRMTVYDVTGARLDPASVPANGCRRA